MTFTQNPVLEGEPILEFQPAVDLATGRLLGFEALLRWNHPTRGHIPPGILIPWAEANDHILELNAWVLAEACLEAQRWPLGIQIAVNLSVIQLQRGEGAVAVLDALEESGLNPDRLTVEITEDVISDELSAADLHALSAIGVHLAVDDVGNNWTSMNSLQRFSVDTVKIDRPFVAGLESDQGVNRCIVEALVHVSHSMSMCTVAEGAETAQQVAILREFGADVAQGFFFAKPLPADDALELAATEQRAVFSLGTDTGDTVFGTTHVQPQPLTLLISEHHRPVLHLDDGLLAESRSEALAAAAKKAAIEAAATLAQDAARAEGPEDEPGARQLLVISHDGREPAGESAAIAHGFR
jgi:EAL domain-containing protein (putative c-di-GMP-specific phosphodiesterase class I)